MLNEIDLSRTDLNLLVLFEVVMAERHVGRSARRLNLSPSAVSHGLGRLRAAFADPLFLKTPRGVVPTARAAELAAPVADILARVRAVVSITTHSIPPGRPAAPCRRRPWRPLAGWLPWRRRSCCLDSSSTSWRRGWR